ncbi:hypothetical protein CRE_11134 [Caenorhabditis remanei]|uniref:ShKT domain-containing protein n=1 Tax=Caenorhabditis remanei TaxID=31234 RepID=E3M5S5_CAERE|nr:hypothetical protein CRE_11134 [Caenorhabditis remanei]
MNVLILLVFLIQICLAQYGMYGGYGGYGGGYGGYGGYGSYGMPYGMGGPFMGNGMYGLPDAPPDFPIPLPPNPSLPNPTKPPTTESQRDCRGLPSMRSRSLCRYGNPMMNGMGGMYGAGGCMDMNPQCSVWASTGEFLMGGGNNLRDGFPGQCALNAIVMRQTCALSCGTCEFFNRLEICGTKLVLGASGLGGLGGIGNLGTSSIYSPYGGLGGLGGLGTGGLDQYPLSQFIGRSIYETGLLNRQPSPHSSKNIGIITKAKSEQLPSRR